MSCCQHGCHLPGNNTGYRRALWAALGVNVAMFFIEIIASVAAGSVSLQADAIDFLGDAANYTVALAVAGIALQWCAGAALLKGVVMGLFGLCVAGSTIYSAIAATVPKAELMGAIGLLAFAANLAVAALLYRYREGDSQAMSVWLCTRNDCLVNLAVIAAGAGVWTSQTQWPDIAVAAVVASLALSSAARLIRRALGEMRVAHPLFRAAAE
jgi:Co/Zn/Cd efflux system component